MRKVLLSVCSLLPALFIFISGVSAAADVTINGSAYFKCNFISKYMEKHGYSYIREVSYNENMKTNLFAARDATVIIKDSGNNIVGYGRTDRKGNFSISVPRDESYQIIVQFHGQEIKKQVPYPEAKRFIADLGYFSTEKVGRWIDSELDW